MSRKWNKNSEGAGAIFEVPCLKAWNKNAKYELCIQGETVCTGKAEMPNDVRVLQDWKTVGERMVSSKVMRAKERKKAKSSRFTRLLMDRTYGAVEPNSNQNCAMLIHFAHRSLCGRGGGGGMTTAD